MNHVVVSGNLTKDCELRSTSGGTSILNFSIAVNDRRKNGSGYDVLNGNTGSWERWVED